MGSRSREPVKEKGNASATRRKVEALAAKLVDESPLAAATGKERLARAAAGLSVYLERLIEERLAGEINAEEARNIPGIASNLKRFMADLKISGDKAAELDDPDDEDDDDSDD
jgi:hypothetical protein